MQPLKVALIIFYLNQPPGNVCLVKDLHVYVRVVRKGRMLAVLFQCHCLAAKARYLHNLS